MAKVKPIERDSDALRESGSAICGEKILAEARKFKLKGLAHATSGHRIQRYDLEKNAYCVIVKAFRIREN